MNTGGLWVGVSESHLFVFLFAFIRSCSPVISAGPWVTEWSWWRYGVCFLKRDQVLEIVLTSDWNLDFCVLQVLSAAGYHVLSLDYRGEMRRDVLNTNLNSCCFCGSDDPTSSLTAQNISQLYSCRTFYMTMQPKVSHITKLIDDRKNNARLKITIKQYDVKDQ